MLFLSYPLLLCCWEWLSSTSVQNKMVVLAVPESEPFAVSFWHFRGGTGLAASSTAVFHWHREHWYHKSLGPHLLNKSRSWRSPLESCDGTGFKALFLLFVATCRYSGWEIPLSLRAEHLSHIGHDLLGEKCPSSIDNQWCRHPQRKISSVTFLPFQAYIDPVLFGLLFLQGRYQKCCLCGQYLFWSVGQNWPLRFSEVDLKSAEFCLVFPCHK